MIASYKESVTISPLNTVNLKGIARRNPVSIVLQCNGERFHDDEITLTRYPTAGRTPPPHSPTEYKHKLRSAVLIVSGGHPFLRRERRSCRMASTGRYREGNRVGANYRRFHCPCNAFSTGRYGIAGPFRSL